MNSPAENEGGALRVLLWSPGGAGTHYHGPATSTFRLFSHLHTRYGVEIHLVHGTNEQTVTGPPFAGVLFLHNVLDCRSRLGSILSQVTFIAKGIMWILSNFHRFDVMYTPASNALTILPGLAARACGLPVVGRIAVVGTELEDRGRLRTRLGWTRRRINLMKRFNAIIAISEDIARRLSVLGIDQTKIFSIPNSVDCNRFRPPSPAERNAARKKFGVGEAAVVVTCVGSLSSRKGQHKLVECLSILPSEVVVLLAGPERDLTHASLRRLAGRAVNRLILVPHISEIEEIYFASDVFVLASTDEGMPNSLLEALASGLPAVGTSISGIEELLGGREFGRLVDRNPAEIAAAIESLVGYPRRINELTIGPRQFILAKFSLPAVAESIYLCLRDCARRLAGGERR